MSNWEYFDLALEKFVDFLKVTSSKGEKLKEHHVLFKMGSVVRFIPTDELEEFQGYDQKYTDNFPHHRMKNGSIDFEEILKINKEVWDKQKKVVGEKGKIIRQAYKIFLDDGYPFPGNQGADRNVIPMDSTENEEKPWLLLWIYRNVNIMNLCMGDEFLANCVGAEGRRIDFIEPQILAIISPDLEITRIEI